MGSAFFIEKNPTETNQTTETKIDEFIQEKITAVTPKKIQEITIPTNTSDIQKKSNSNVETNNTATTWNIEENTDTTSTTPTIANEKKIDTPAVTTFSIENPTLKKTISEYLPGAKTTWPKMKRVTFESVVNTVNAIQSKEARETIQELLSDGLVMIAQEYMGMKYQSRFSDNVASGRLDSNTINRMSKPRLLKKWAEVIPELSIDVQKSYRDLLATGEKNKKSYALISKKDCEIYVFSYDHRLLSKNNTLLGPVGDFPPSHEKWPTTPGGSENGSYTIDFIETKHAGFAAPSTYLQLKPDNRKYFDKGYSIGIHTYYQKTSTDTHRLDLLESGTHFRDTNGCINTSVSEAWPIYDNLDIGSRVVISQEPA